ncbi:MAG TPA: hypothetical protein VND93_01015, partial [Myxococcales bacterium]|nr:hypothetical protein [Myxococcales bacterium]
MLTLLQGKFDSGDFRDVDQLLAGRNAPWSLARELLARHPDNAPSCEQKEMISSFRGLIDVTCAAPGVDPYRFHVDLVRRQIRGQDPRSQEVVEAVERKRQLSNDAGR